jgi:hypothetical protein
MNIAKHEHHLTLQAGSRGKIGLLYATKCGKTELTIELLALGTGSVELGIPDCGCYEFYVPSRTMPGDRLWPAGGKCQVILVDAESVAATSKSAHIHSYQIEHQVRNGEAHLTITEQGVSD